MRLHTPTAEVVSFSSRDSHSGLGQRDSILKSRENTKVCENLVQFPAWAGDRGGQLNNKPAVSKEATTLCGKHHFFEHS